MIEAFVAIDNSNENVHTGTIITLVSILDMSCELDMWRYPYRELKGTKQSHGSKVNLLDSAVSPCTYIKSYAESYCKLSKNL